MSTYLDNQGLAYLWSKLKEKLNGKADVGHSHTAGDVGAATTSHNHADSVICPTAIELQPGSSVGHGGYIDFHYNSSAEEYTSRLIEAASGTIQYNGKKILTAANVIAVYNVALTFGNTVNNIRYATYNNSAIAKNSACFVQGRGTAAVSSGVFPCFTTSENGYIRIYTENTDEVSVYVNILIINN